MLSRSLEDSCTFLWNNKMHAWNWKDICRPKSEGVGGIRRLSDIRLLWRTCPSRSLWSNWMNTFYLKGAHISQRLMSFTDLSSDVWLWSASKTGEFCFNSAVRSSGSLFQFANLVWFQCQSQNGSLSVATSAC